MSNKKSRRKRKRNTNKRRTTKNIRRRSINKNVKFFMITYKDNMKFAKETQKVLKKDWGISSKIIMGYKIDKKKYTHTNVIFHGILDKLLPVMLRSKCNAYYIEDDVRFTSHPLHIPKKDVVWSVYRRGSLLNKNATITGSQAIYLSKKAQKLLMKHMEKTNPIQIDGYFSRFINHHKNLLSFKQLKPKIGYEKDHKSLISKDKDWKKYKNPNL